MEIKMLPFVIDAAVCEDFFERVRGGVSCQHEFIIQVPCNVYIIVNAYACVCVFLFPQTKCGTNLALQRTVALQKLFSQFQNHIFSVIP